MSRQFSDNVFLVSSDTAFWQGLNVRDTADIDRVDSAPFVEEKTIAIPGFDNWIVLDEPLLWHREDRMAALVNERFFSELTIVDLTSLNGQLITGTVDPEFLQEWRCEKIVHFLLSSGLLRTFVHSHAELQLIERVTGKLHRECYDACHFMYTNEEVRTDYEFQVEIDTQSGAIVVAPL